jgi:chromosome segregation ATPase
MSHKRLVPSSEDSALARVRRTKEELATLRSSNEVLRNDLARETRETKATAKLTAGKDMGRLQDDADRYARKIEIERQRIQELDNHIAETQQQILAQRQKMGGADASKENSDMIGNKVRMLENRLDKSLVKFNESLASNKQLRAKIDSMRQERVVFDGIYKKLERELHSKKKEMSAIIEDSNNAYQARDKAASEMAALKQQAEKDRSDFEKDWKELGQLIEQDRKLREKLRGDMEKTANTGTTGMSRLSPTGSPQNLPMDVTGQIQPGWVGKDSKEVPLTQDKVKMYEEAFAKIADATGITDVETIVTTFLEAEDKNFSLFNYVNDLNSDIEILELQISDVKMEIEKYKGQGVSTDTQRKQILRNLEERLQRTESKADEYQSRYENAMKTVNQLRQGIGSIFSRIGCASTSVEEMLGNQGVTESNMMQYLGIIEQRTTDILQLYANSQAATDPANSATVGEAKEPAVKHSMEPGMITAAVRQPASVKLSVLPPAFDDFSDGEESDQEDDERPLTRDELTRKTLRGYRKGEKEVKGAGAGKKK